MTTVFPPIPFIALFLAAAFDQRGQGTHRSEMLACIFGIRRQGNAVTLLHRHAQFERVDGIQAQAFDEQWRIRIDIVRCDIFQLQHFDDQILDFQF